jgi:methionyl-tRNA formyltransferase
MTGWASPAIVFFGTPSQFSTLALERLAARWKIAAVVLPRAGGVRQSLRRAIGWQSTAIEHLAKKHRIPLAYWDAYNPAPVEELLMRQRPDLVCVAGFPKLIPLGMVADAPLGAVNLHPSLLPRHRGPLPLFWTYHGDDRVAGITVHDLTDRFDAGDIILQHSFPLPRGYPVNRLDHDVAVSGTELLNAAVEALASGGARRIRQDERAATLAPHIRRDSPMVNFEEWDVERVWHFLAALCPGFREPLKNRDGVSVTYQRVLGFERGSSSKPGLAERHDKGWRLHCRSGTVILGS